MSLGRILRPRVTFARAVNATQYAAGDEVSNHVTAGSVVRPTLNMSGIRQGRILAAEIDLTEGSAGNVVTTASDFELLVFKTADAPAAVGDNVTHPIAAAERAKAVARFRFDDTGWTGPLGTVAAGTSQVQAVMATLVQPLATNVLEYPHVFGCPFTFEGSKENQWEFTYVLRALAAWNPLGVILTFGITLDIEAI
jgi:hypothetical protein